ncbi:MAG: DUF362 domain-containing protein [Clostridia bacterium]|nr:DUF362 domain-containing protein [Clostridia bacterium]
MSTVSIVRCDDYEVEKVKSAIKESIDKIGGMSAFVKPGETVLLKVNLLIKRKPEKVTTTHPSFAQALAELVIEAGGKPVIGDSPGGYHFYNKGSLESVYETCGMKDAAKKSGAELNYNTDVIDVPYPDGVVMKSIKTIKPVIEVDKIINIPKIKTHMMTVYSGAVKNMFGIIPGSYKAEYHLRFDDTGDFANLLIDICSFSKPVLTVMDAVLGMEGYGPTNGHPKKVGLVLASSDPFALDVTATDIIGIEPGQVPTIRKSVERNLCTGNIGDIEVVGEEMNKIRVLDFKKPTVKVAFNFYNILLPKFIVKRLNRIIKPTPRFNMQKCKGCGMCAKSCPPKTIEMVGGKPVVKLDKCIRCFCCHELCNYDAVDIKRPWFIRMVLR